MAAERLGAWGANHFLSNDFKLNASARRRCGGVEPLCRPEYPSNLSRERFFFWILNYLSSQDEALINSINAANVGWTAGHNDRFKGYTLVRGACAFYISTSYRY